MEDPKPSGPALRFGSRRIALPAGRTARTVLGASLCVGGLLGVLPILGFWMLPLGVLVLSADFHPVRRMRRRFESAWGRRKGRPPRKNRAMKAKTKKNEAGG